MQKLNSIVSSKWLNDNLNQPELIILDVSKDPDKSNSQKIKGARYVDLKDEFSDTSNEFPNTLPPPGEFEISCRKLGINKASHIVVYDNIGIFNSPRVWWMFKIMGHENVSVLDGGLPDWIAQGYDTETIESVEHEQGNFEAKFHPNMAKDHAFVKVNLKDKNSIVVDARSEGRFNGTAPEPRAGLRSGHVPNSVNIPFQQVLENGKFKSTAELDKVFLQLKNETRPLVFSCGSGVTACILLLAAESVLDNQKSIYDGSWTEWATLEHVDDV